MAKILIDPGHGPGNANKGPTGYFEHVGMWILSKHLQAALIRCGITAALTRAEDAYPGTTARGTMARGYDCFISQHSNAGAASARGCEVYYSGLRPNDKKWAAEIAIQSAQLMGNPNRGALTKGSAASPGQDYYGVIRAAAATGCPHIFLVESGFHSNPQDEAWLKSSENLKKLAEAQAAILCQMLGVKYVSEVVKTAHWGEPLIRQLMDDKVITSWHDPNDVVTWAELAAVVIKMKEAK